VKQLRNCRNIRAKLLGSHEESARCIFHPECTTDFNPKGAGIPIAEDEPPVGSTRRGAATRPLGNHCGGEVDVVLNGDRAVGDDLYGGKCQRIGDVAGVEILIRAIYNLHSDDIWCMHNA
jgi:hypothetical protein